MRLIDADAFVLNLRELKLVECTIRRDVSPRNSIRWWQYQTLIWFIDALIKTLKDPDRVPTIEAEPVKHGEWAMDYDCGAIVYVCSLCGEHYWTEYEHDKKPNYCPHCGAHMKEG